MKKVIVLPGAEAQIPLINRLKRAGYHVTVFHPVVPGPCQGLADEFREVDILDKEECLKLAQMMSPDAVISDMCDIAMPTVAYLCKELGVPGLSEHHAALYTNKAMMREFCEDHRLPSPKYRVCKDREDAKEFIRTHQCKSIIKPLDSNSSRGVHTIESVQEVDEYFEDALKYSKCDSGVIIEEYVDGIEFTVDGVMTSEGHKSLAISEKKHYPHNKNIAYELFFSHHNKCFDYDKLRATNDAFVNLSELRPGTLTHAEYKYSNGQFYMIEIGARGGGNYISSTIVPLISGVDNYGLLISAALQPSTDINIADLNRSKKCAVLYFFDVDQEGHVKAIKNENLLRENSDVLEYKFNFDVGDYICKAENDSKRVGYYIAKGKDEESLRRLMREIKDNLSIEVE